MSKYIIIGVISVLFESLIVLISKSGYKRMLHWKQEYLEYMMDNIKNDWDEHFKMVVSYMIMFALAYYVHNLILSWIIFIGLLIASVLSIASVIPAIIEIIVKIKMNFLYFMRLLSVINFVIFQVAVCLAFLLEGIVI